MPKAAVIMGSDSDLPVLKKGIALLREWNVEVVVRALSAHRTPVEAAEFARNAESEGFSLIIAAAGMAAHLAGAMAAHTVLPVIGVPVASGPMNGRDALYSTVMMPPGVPVATVGIDAGENAALLAAQIMALGDGDLRRRLHEHKRAMAEKVARKNQNLMEQAGQF